MRRKRGIYRFAVRQGAFFAFFARCCLENPAFARPPAGLFYLAPGPEQMQIEVVDDCSNDNTASEVTRRLGAARVTFHAESQNRGLANNWNRCIERARGHWVHILHQDDFVLPGFYDDLRKGAEQSDAGAVFCRYTTVNAKAEWIATSELQRESAGLLEDWHARITVQQLIRCPAIARAKAGL
jgi:Glycosyl transferase family 2